MDFTNTNTKPLTVDAGGASSGGSSGGVIAGVDTADTKWLMVINSSVTPPSITYINQSTGVTGTPVGGFTADSDQNGLTNAQLRSSEVSVVTPLPASTVTGQLKIATTNSVVQLPSNVLKNGIVIKAKSSNSQSIFVGQSGVVTTDDGTGSGYKIDAGESIAFAVQNSNTIYINGSAGDIIYFAGN